MNQKETMLAAHRAGQEVGVVVASGPSGWTSTTTKYTSKENDKGATSCTRQRKQVPCIR